MSAFPLGERQQHRIGQLVHIPVDGERGFQRIVNADSRGT